jgi:integrase
MTAGRKHPRAAVGDARSGSFATANPSGNRAAEKDISAGQVELTGQTRQAVDDYLKGQNKRPGEFLFTGRLDVSGSMTTRQYARLLSDWTASIGLDPKIFGTHSLRRTKATLIYRRTGNLRAVQLLLGHIRIESTVRYLGIEVDDALSIAEQIDV